jgi:regulator of sigma E protease
MQVVGMSIVILYTLGLLIIGKISILDLAGPVGIANMTGQVAGEGLVPLLSFTAFLSINLGLANLLPIPALDGGRLVFIIIEWIRKKAIDINLENKIHSVGLTILLALMAVVTVNDIFRIFRR